MGALVAPCASGPCGKCLRRRSAWTTRVSGAAFMSGSSVRAGWACEACRVTGALSRCGSDKGIHRGEGRREAGSGEWRRASGEWRMAKGFGMVAGFRVSWCSPCLRERTVPTRQPSPAAFDGGRGGLSRRRGGHGAGSERRGLLAQGLEEDDGHAVGQVQGTGLGVGHGDVDPTIRGGFKKGAGQAGGLASEDEDVAGGKRGVVIGARGSLLDEPRSAARAQVSDKGVPVGPSMPGDVLPVVHAGAAELAVVEVEPEGLDEVQRGAGGGAESGDVAGVGRDLGLEKDDLEHGRGRGRGRWRSRLGSGARGRGRDKGGGIKGEG